MSDPTTHAIPDLLTTPREQLMVGVHQTEKVLFHVPPERRDPLREALRQLLTEIRAASDTDPDTLTTLSQRLLDLHQRCVAARPR